MACGVLVPQRGIKAVSPSLGPPSLTPTREVLVVVVVFKLVMRTYSITWFILLYHKYVLKSLKVFINILITTCFFFCSHYDLLNRF